MDQVSCPHPRMVTALCLWRTAPVSLWMWSKGRRRAFSWTWWGVGDQGGGRGGGQGRGVTPQRARAFHPTLSHLCECTGGNRKPVGQCMVLRGARILNLFAPSSHTCVNAEGQPRPCGPYGAPWSTCSQPFRLHRGLLGPCRTRRCRTRDHR